LCSQPSSFFLFRSVSLTSCRLIHPFYGEPTWSSSQIAILWFDFDSLNHVKSIQLVWNDALSCKNYNKYPNVVCSQVNYPLKRHTRDMASISTTPCAALTRRLYSRGLANKPFDIRHVNGSLDSHSLHLVAFSLTGSCNMETHPCRHGQLGWCGLISVCNSLVQMLITWWLHPAVVRVLHPSMTSFYCSETYWIRLNLSFFAQKLFLIRRSCR